MRLLCVLGRKKCEFSDKEIDDERRRLGRQWNQSVSQVLDEEAVYYLRARRKEGGEKRTGVIPDLGTKYCPCGWEMSNGCPVGH